MVSTPAMAHSEPTILPHTPTGLGGGEDQYRLSGRGADGSEIGVGINGQCYAQLIFLSREPEMTT